MSKVICIAGESGSGKTTSMRNLDPASTYYIDADKKGLSWKGWKQQYNKENKNYSVTSDALKIEALINNVSENAPHIKVIVIDTLNGIMIDDEFNRMKEKGYDKWQDLAMSVWNLVSMAHWLRDDLTVIFTAHTQTERDDSGFAFTRIKTSGKKLDKIVLESKFTTVLISKCVDGDYVFETQARNSTAKTPFGAYSQDEFTVPNDIVTVLKRLEDY
jgi:RecA/RadA recombinase